MKVCSFLPAATQMIYDMGLDTYLEGVTFECPTKALKEKEVVVRCIIENNNYSSHEIDKIFSESKRNNKSLYWVENQKLKAIEPDIIFTQDTCEVCQIDTNCARMSIAFMDKPATLIPLSPNSLEDVFNTALTIAQSLNCKEKGVAYVSENRQRLNAILEIQKNNCLKPINMALLEWIDPFYNCGHWIPDQIKQAGGIDQIANPHGDSSRITLTRILNYNPDILVIAPCGFSIERTERDLNVFIEKNPIFKELSAFKNNRIFLANYDLFTQPSLSTLIDGIELLSHFFYPRFFNAPDFLNKKWKLYS
ncbi:MAG: ABC transporter substrate-binding protein [Phycisphaerales bacterium]|nr:ABC transporter substrate-binding protein [Phycisphaerales bacterium]